ncbi:MAG: Gfo/Idh/MocA family oxidoreductase [Chloroflexi bacterium]|nr:Gfo/Idh/MocA family oxidoreductase [Chloroflexota bacterium]
MTRDHRLVIIGAGWIVPRHLAALDRLGRATLVGVASATMERATAIATPRGAVASTDPLGLVDSLRPDIAYLCVAPSAAVALGEALAERAIPFLAEKPLAATDAAGPARLAASIARRGLVVAVGYHLRGLDGMGELRMRLAADPVRLVAGRWLDATPAAPWWRRVDQGGGQVIEQATHLYDLGRHLVGEAGVVCAASVRDDPPTPPGADVADSTVAIVRYDNGAVGTFANTRRQTEATIELELVSDGLRSTIRRVSDDAGGWQISTTDETGTRTIPSRRDPYEVQAEAFLDAVEAGNPDAVLSTYADALRTDRLTRAVVAATGQPG